MKVNEDFFFDCLVNGTRFGAIMLFVFTLIGFVEVMTIGIDVGNHWLFNNKLFGIFFVVGFVGGVIKTVGSFLRERLNIFQSE